MTSLSIPSLASPALEQLVADALAYLQTLGYSVATLSIYRGIWQALIRFAQGEPEPAPFSASLCLRFLAFHDVPVGEVCGTLPTRKRQFRTATRVLIEFAERGDFYRRRRRTEKKIQCPVFDQALQDYLTFCQDYLNYGHRTLRLYRYALTEFLHFLESQGVASLASISGALITQFVAAQAHLSAATVNNRIAALRSFLRHLKMRALITEDLSSQIPTLRRPRHERLPGVWTPTQVDALLAAVDRGSPQGQRDYAILLLACRLGMRVGDIRTLRLEHLLWDDARIEFAQAKTGTPLSLPMSEEIGQALIHYLRQGRPASAHREVFLRLIAPFEPFGANNNLYPIIDQYRRHAGIELPDRNRGGLHSLRHTLASRLLEQQTPIETISDILGHQRTESTRVYTQIDLNALQTVALDLEEVDHA